MLMTPPGTPTSTGDEEKIALSVESGHKRIDVRLLPSADLGEIRTQLLRLLLPAESGGSAEWDLLTVTGLALPLQGPLAASGLVDGDRILLERRVQSESRTRMDPLKAQMAEPELRLWSLGSSRVVCAWWLALIISVLAVGACVAPLSKAQSWSLAGMGVVATLGAMMAARNRLLPAPWLVLPAVALSGVGLGRSMTGSSPEDQVAAGLAALVVVAGLLATESSTRPSAMGLCVFSIPATAAVVGATLAGRGLEVAAAATVGILSLLLPLLPRLAATSVGSSDPGTKGGGSSGSHPEKVFAAAVSGARPVLSGMIWGFLAATALCGALLVISGQISTALLLVGAGVTSLARAGVHRLMRDRGLMILAGAVLMAEAAATAINHYLSGSNLVGAALLLAVLSAVVGLAVGATRFRSPDAATRRLLRRIEITSRITVIPLALWAAGVLSSVHSSVGHLVKS